MSEESSFSEDSPSTWIQWFCELDDHIYFCEIEPEYIQEPFNLYGLKARVERY